MYIVCVYCVFCNNITYGRCKQVWAAIHVYIIYVHCICILYLYIVCMHCMCIIYVYIVYIVIILPMDDASRFGCHTCVCCMCISYVCMCICTLYVMYIVCVYCVYCNNTTYGRCKQVWAAIHVYVVCVYHMCTCVYVHCM